MKVQGKQLLLGKSREVIKSKASFTEILKYIECMKEDTRLQ